LVVVCACGEGKRERKKCSSTLTSTSLTGWYCPCFDRTEKTPSNSRMIVGLLTIMLVSGENWPISHSCLFSQQHTHHLQIWTAAPYSTTVLWIKEVKAQHTLERWQLMTPADSRFEALCPLLMDCTDNPGYLKLLYQSFLLLLCSAGFSPVSGWFITPVKCACTERETNWWSGVVSIITQHLSVCLISKSKINSRISLCERVITYAITYSIYYDNSQD